MPLGGAPDCPACGQKVYFSDEKGFSSKKWHKKCFKCGACQKMLESGTANLFGDSDIYCNSCVRKVTAETNAKQPKQELVDKTNPECCPRCGKRVYFAEQVLGLGRKWHKLCFKCGSCGKLVDSTSSADHENELYCKPCHGKLYGPKGYGFAGGAGTLLSMGDKQGTDAPRTAEAYIAPKRTSPDNGASNGTGKDMCMRCGKTVYLAEKRMGAGSVFHISCFLCAACNKRLDSGNLAEREGDIYCKSCYGKNFGPKGYGYGTGAGTLQMN